MASGHFQVVPATEQGRKFIMGDVHGNLVALKAVIESLKPENCLFIVGDLLDRGSDSAGVLDYLIEHIEQKKTPKIYMTRGNHEDVLVDYIHYRLNNDLHAHSRFHVTVSSSNPNILPKLIKQVNSQNEMVPEIKALNNNYGKWAHEVSNGKLAEYLHFISSLPYIIRVEGSNPFNVVHAGMPFDDRELLSRINTDLPLTKSEMRYCLHARMTSGSVPLKSNGRDYFSDRTYVGHEINGGARPDTNEINLDVALYYTHCILLMDHEKNECNLMRVNPQISTSPKVLEYIRRAGIVQLEINNHLFLQAILKKLAGIVETINVPPSEILLFNFKKAMENVLSKVKKENDFLKKISVLAEFANHMHKLSQLPKNKPSLFISIDFRKNGLVETCNNALPRDKLNLLLLPALPLSPPVTP